MTPPVEPVRTIITPRGAEATAVRRALARLEPGAAAIRLVVLPAGAAAATSLPGTLDEPIVVVGLCGALRDRTVGDVVVYRRVSGDGRSVALDPAFAAALVTMLPGAHLVDACSTAHVVTTVRERAELAGRYAADVVDMEGLPLAVALELQRRPFAMVRVVSDDAARDLPALERAIDDDGELDPGQIARALIRRPRAALAFLRDVRAALGVLTATVAGIARTTP